MVHFVLCIWSKMVVMHAHDISTYTLANQQTESMDQSPLCEADRLVKFLNNQYHVHKTPPLVPVLSHMNSVHPLPSCLFKIHFSVIFPSMPASQSDMDPVDLPVRTLYACVMVSCHLPCWSYPPWSDNPIISNNHRIKSVQHDTHSIYLLFTVHKKKLSVRDHESPHCAVFSSFLFISHVSRYLTVHPLLEHPQSLFIH